MIFQESEVVLVTRVLFFFFFKKKGVFFRAPEVARTTLLALSDIVNTSCHLTPSRVQAAVLWMINTKNWRAGAAAGGAERPKSWINEIERMPASCKNREAPTPPEMQVKEESARSGERLKKGAANTIPANDGGERDAGNSQGTAREKAASTSQALVGSVEVDAWIRIWKAISTRTDADQSERRGEHDQN